MSEIPDGAREKMARWLCDRSSLSFDDCSVSEQEKWLWEAEFTICKVLRLCDEF